jgi:hypothetical protein
MSQLKGPFSRPVLFYLEVGHTTFLRNIGKRLPDYRVLHHKVTVVRTPVPNEMLCFLDSIRALTFCLQSAACIMPLILCFKYVSQSTFSEITAVNCRNLEL